MIDIRIALPALAACSSPALPAAERASDSSSGRDAVLAAHRRAAEADRQAVLLRRELEAAGLDAVYNRSVEQRGDAWCFTSGSGAMGESVSWTLCMRDGDIVGAGSYGNNDDGIVEGSWGIIRPRTDD